MARLLLVLVLLFPGCAAIPRPARATGRPADVGRPDEPAARELLYLQLQLGVVSDSVVTHLLQLTEAPLLAAKDASERKVLLTLRLYYASVLWNAASGPNPQTNAIDMLVTFAVGQKVVEEPRIAAALGSALQPTRDLLASGEREIDKLVARFLNAAEYQALRDAIAAQASSSLKGLPMETIDLRAVLGAATTHAGEQSPNLLHLLGMDPFAGLDPATREIAETRQFGERLLFTIQRLPFIIRLNGEMLANDAAHDVGVERLIASLERASSGISQMAATASALPDRLEADLSGEPDQLGAVARDFRSALEAATAAAAATNQVLQTYAGLVDRSNARGGKRFDITEYSRTAATIGDAATNLSGLLDQAEKTVESPGLARLTPRLTVMLDAADQRGRRLLYTAFALGCVLIVLASLAAIMTVTILRRGREGPSPRISRRTAP